MRTLYGEIEPFRVSRVDVGDGHELYVEEVGNPHGIPAVFLHGGPGGGLTPTARRFFDPAAFRVVLFDQRGCGRSTPLGGIEANTTAHLVADIETIRERLGIEKWLVFGGSWGSTLALAYAQSHVDRVTALILRGIFLMSSSETDWFYRGGAGHLQPEEWERFVAAIPGHERDDVLAAYLSRLLGDDRAEALRVAEPWLRWELANSFLQPDLSVLGSLPDDLRLGFTRVMAHYVANRGFFDSNDQLLAGVEVIRQLPCTIVQGRYDLCCPPFTAYDLATRWPEAELVVVPDAGHASTEPGIADALVRATDAFVHAGRDSAG